MSTNYKGSSKHKRSLDTVITLRRCVSCLDLAYSRFLKDYHLGLPQFEILDALYHLGQLKPMDLATKMNSSPAAITYLVGRLVADGFVLRSISKKDKRSFELVLSESGFKKVEEVLEKFAQFSTELISTLDIQEQQALNHLTKTLGLKIKSKLL
jgi:DNA-binding MarR family transcriptional regulator